jgi:phenylacetate-CoA ligase
MSLRDALYARAPIWLQNASLSAYGAILRSRRYGGIHSKALHRLLENEKSSSAAIAALQLEQLKTIIVSASATPLYKGRGLLADAVESLGDLADLPLLAKDDLRRPAEELIRVEDIKRAIVLHTGGTTGSPLSVYCDRPALQRNYAFFERLRRTAGIMPNARVATFAGRAIVPTGQNAPPFWRHNRVARTMLFSSYHISVATLPSYIDALSHFNPDLIDSYPSNLELMARYILDRGIDCVRPRAIITSSETLLPSVREAIENAFGCRVYDHYGSTEMAAFITQCERGTYHVNPDFGIVELLREGRPAQDGEAGEIVATGFVNPMMPLIRYRTGDLAVRMDAPCACGRNFPAIARIEGRMDDYVITPEGFSVGRLDPIFKAVDSIVETRIVQDAVDHVRIEIVPGARFSDQDSDVLVQELRKRVGQSMKISVGLVGSLPRTSGGKLRMVVNEVYGRNASAPPPAPRH